MSIKEHELKGIKKVLNPSSSKGLVQEVWFVVQLQLSAGEIVWSNTHPPPLDKD